MGPTGMIWPRLLLIRKTLCHAAFGFAEAQADMLTILMSVITLCLGSFLKTVQMLSFSTFILWTVV